MKIALKMKELCPSMSVDKIFLTSEYVYICSEIHLNATLQFNKQVVPSVKKLSKQIAVFAMPSCVKNSLEPIILYGNLICNCATKNILLPICENQKFSSGVLFSKKKTFSISSALQQSELLIVCKDISCFLKSLKKLRSTRKQALPHEASRFCVEKMFVMLFETAKLVNKFFLT